MAFRRTPKLTAPPSRRRLSVCNTHENLPWFYPGSTLVLPEPTPVPPEPPPRIHPLVRLAFHSHLHRRRGGRSRGVAGGWFTCILNLISSRLFIIPFRSWIVGRFCISPRHPCIVCGCGLSVFVCVLFQFRTIIAFMLSLFFISY